MPTVNTKNLNGLVKHRYYSEADWIISDPVILQGEVAVTPAVGSIPAKTKIGDGVLHWSQLSYTTSKIEANISSLETQISLINGGAIGGVDINEVNVIVERLDTKEEVWDENTLYTNATPIVEQFRDIAPGTVFDDAPIKDILTKILYPYMNPTISLSATGLVATNIYEKGATLNPSIELRATAGKKSDAISSLLFYKDSTVINTKNTTTDPTLGQGGIFTYTHPTTGIVSDCIFNVAVKDARNTTVTSNNINLKFYNPAYVGSVDPTITSGTITETDIKALTKKIQAPANLNNDYTINNKKMIIACPPGWTISKIYDANNFDITSSFETFTKSIVCLDDSTQTYNVYLSSATTQTAFTVKYNR